MNEKKKYDSTVARIAGNIAAGLVRNREYFFADSGGVKVEMLAADAGEAARFIVAEVERTESVPFQRLHPPAPEEEG